MQEKLALLEWLAANYKKFGCVLEFVTNKSQEGSQFCRGFGGIGGILRYQVGLPVLPGIVTKGSRGHPGLPCHPSMCGGMPIILRGCGQGSSRMRARLPPC